MPEKKDEMMDRVVARAWQDEAFKQKLISKPHEALRELGIDIPDSVKLEIHEETMESRHMIIPMNPSNMQLPDDVVDKVAGGTGVWTCGPHFP